jgi:lycopene cyclase domain-containing protein
LALELVWAGPIIVAQWLLGLDLMIRRWKVWLPGIAFPAVYLTFADTFGLGAHIWTVNPALSLRIILPFGVPLEELVFFLVTNTMLVQGLLLVSSPSLGHRLGRLWRVIRRGRAALAAQKSPKGRSNRPATGK